MKPAVLIGLMALWILPAVATAQGGVLIVPSGPMAPGQQGCVPLLTTVPLGQLTSVVEIGGIEVRSTITRSADGGVEVCFPVPRNTAGATITITVTGGGSVSSGNVNVSPPPSAGGG